VAVLGMLVYTYACGQSLAAVPHCDDTRIVAYMTVVVKRVYIITPTPPHHCS